MIAFDQLRSALLATDPYAAMDALVRGELTAGRKTKAVYDDLLGHIEAVREMPGYTDEVENNLGDTLDALCGFVHPSCAYTDPPEGCEAAPPPTAEANGHPSAPPAHSTPSPG